MGFLNDLLTLNRQANEIRAQHDPVAKAQAQSGRGSMRAARVAMQSATAVATDASARSGCATVLRVVDTCLRVGRHPVAEIDLLVDVDGRLPFPARVRTGVPLGGAGQAELGALVAVRVVGESVAVLWGVPAR
ncbi:hypothetical protein [Longivirga aurantiaca]|uniref:Uncharacterized protein n=1 Tax=Longivirga aurantiaca TaxID=1837743 RepID=A0ABW1SW91_9ACTN